MAVNKGVVVGAVGITAAGVIAAVLKHQPITKVVIGGYLIAVIGGVIDLFGGGASQLASSIVMMAFFGVLLYEADVLSKLLRVPNQSQTPPPEQQGGGGGGKK